MGIFSKNKKSTEEVLNSVTEDSTEKIVDIFNENKEERLSKSNEKGIASDIKKLTTVVTDDDTLSEYEKEVEDARKIVSIIEDSFIQKYIKDTTTDISFNGTALWVQDNREGRYKPELQPTENDVERLASRIASIKGMEFTDSDPIMDVEINGLRINTVHKIISPAGTTMSVRISKPRLAITDIEQVSTRDVADLLKACILADESLVISGITGSGKTELQKALVGHIPLSKKITLIEDSMDSHLKALYPEKDINSWRSLLSSSRANKITFEVLIKAALRNNPDWLIISEIRGSDAYDFNNALLTGHSGLTTIHASGANNIPSRMRNMIAQQYDIDPLLLGQDIIENLHFGIHMEMVQDETGIYRRIREVVEYVGYDETGVVSNFLYRIHKEYDEKTNTYKPLEQLNPITQNASRRFKRKELYHLIPEVFRPIESKAKR